MIFLRNEKFREYIKLYPVTSLVLIVNTLLFLLMTASGGSMNNQVLVRFGAMVGMAPFDHQYWRLLSAVFLHIGFDHWLFNSFAIFVFAPPLERIMGKWRYLMLYLASGVIGNMISSLFFDGISAGASGAIFGVYGAYIYMGLFRKYLLDQQSRKTITIILAVGIVYSLVVPNINLWAHLGGFAGGFLLFGVLHTSGRNG